MKGDIRWQALVLHADDDVGVALRDLQAGEAIDVRCAGENLRMAIRESIPLGHKFALRAVGTGARICWTLPAQPHPEHAHDSLDESEPSHA